MNDGEYYRYYIQWLFNFAYENRAPPGGETQFHDRIYKYSENCIREKVFFR